jgi:putative transposase
MGSDPSPHHRHSLRLPSYDYTQPGAYFVTLCTHQRVCSLGAVADGQMQLNHWGRAVAECWAAIPAHFAHAALDEWVVMPNHVHGILVITDVAVVAGDAVGARHCRAPTQPEQFGQPVPGSIPTILRSFKSAVTKRINALRGVNAPPVWQRNYYEHVIRNEKEQHAIREYIRLNPMQWALDRDNPDAGRPAAQ